MSASKRSLMPGSSRGLTRRGVLVFGVVLAAVAAGVAIGVNAGGLRDRLVGRNVPQIGSLAVLPMENRSEAPEHAYLADAVSREIAGELQRLGVWRVPSNPSVAKYQNAPKPLPDIARELDVDALVEGSVRWAGEHADISANLVHATTSGPVWSRTYERRGDLQALVSEIARDIARATGATLTREQEARLASRPHVDPRAYVAYLRGVATPARFEEHMNEAIRIDPGFAAPYESLSSRVYTRNMFPTLPPADTHPRARELAKKALSLDPHRSPPHRVLAGIALEYDWNFHDAQKHYQRALEIMPSYPVGRHFYAHYLLAMDRTKEAAAETRRALDIDPSSSFLVACGSWHHIATGEYDEAGKQALRALGMGAPDQLARVVLGWSYQLRGRHEQALPEFQKAVVGWKNAVFPTAALAHGYAVAGQAAAAREVLDKLLARSKTEYVSPYEIAVIHAGLGDADRAFEWLEKAYADRATFLVYFRMDPRIWSLRSDARFQALLRRMNFPEESTE